MSRKDMMKIALCLMYGEDLTSHFYVVDLL